MCWGLHCNEDPPPEAAPIESNGMELNLVNFHPESFNKGLSWTGLVIALVLMVLFIYKLYPIIEKWVEERRHRTQMRMNRRELMMGFASNSIPMSTVKRQPGARNTSYSIEQQPPTDFSHDTPNPNAQQESAPPLKDCPCQSCKDMRLFPGLKLNPTCAYR